MSDWLISEAVRPPNKKILYRVNKIGSSSFTATFKRNQID